MNTPTIIATFQRLPLDPNQFVAFMAVGSLASAALFGLFMWVRPARKTQDALSDIARWAFWPLAGTWLLAYIFRFFWVVVVTAFLIAGCWFVSLAIILARPERDWRPPKR